MMQGDSAHSWIFRANRIGVILLLAALAFLVAGIPKLEFSSDSRGFFGSDNEEFQDVVAIEETYTVSTRILLMVVPPEGAAFAPENLRILQQITDDAWQMPYALRIDSPVNHMHSYSQDDDIFVEPMLDEFAEVTTEAADRFQKLAMASDTLRNTLLSDTGDAFGLTIRVAMPDGVAGARKEVEQALVDMRAGWQAAYPDWEIRATSGLLGNNLLARVAIADILYLVPIALLAVIFLLWLALGSIVAVAASLAVLVSATLATFGFAGWINVALTAGTAISPLAVMVLVSTSCVHIILGTIRAAEAGFGTSAFKHAISSNLAPVTVSHLTTAFGFLCLNFAPSPPLASMGNIVAFGLVFGHFSVIILLPAFLAKRPLTKAGCLLPSGFALQRFAHWVLGLRRVWLVVFPAGAVLALIGVMRIDYDDNVIRYFDHRYELRQDAEAIQTQLTGLEPLQFSLRSADGNSVFDPDFLRTVDRFAVWLAGQDDVVAVSGLTDIIKDINQSMSGDDPNAYAIADTQPANAQLMMFYELSLPVGMDMNAIMDVDRTQTLLTANVRATHSSQIRTLAERAEAWLVENEPSIATRATGMPIAFARISQRNNAQMIYGFLTVLAIVSGVLIVTLHSVKYGLMSLIPNLMPAVLAFGFWGLTKGDVNLGSTVVTTMTFGIVVDDTVHFLMHYLKRRRAGRSADDAIEDTFVVVGSSIIVTSVALITGFGIMAASGFSINQHIGMLTAVVIVFALLSDLLFLPAMLKTFQGRPK